MGIRRLWQMLSIGAPWAVSNWLWANIISPLTAGVRQITLRRIVYLAAFLVMIYGAAQLLPVDLAMIFAGDSALYFEVVTLAYIAIAQNRLYRAVAPAERMLYASLRRSGQALVRTAARAKRSTRLPRLFDNEDSGDLPDGVFA